MWNTVNGLPSIVDRDLVTGLGDGDLRRAGCGGNRGQRASSDRRVSRERPMEVVPHEIVLDPDVVAARAGTSDRRVQNPKRMPNRT